MDWTSLVWGITLGVSFCSITYVACRLSKSVWSSADKTPTQIADTQREMLSQYREHLKRESFLPALESFFESCQKTLPLSTLLTVIYKDGSSRVFSFGTSFPPVHEAYRALTTGGSITLSQTKSSPRYWKKEEGPCSVSLGLLPEGMRIRPDKTTQISRSSAPGTRRREGT